MIADASALVAVINQEPGCDERAKRPSDVRHARCVSPLVCSEALLGVARAAASAGGAMINSTPEILAAARELVDDLMAEFGAKAILILNAIGDKAPAQFQPTPRRRRSYSARAESRSDIRWDSRRDGAHKAMEANEKLTRLVGERSQANLSPQGLINRLAAASQNLGASASMLHQVVTTFIEPNCSPPPRVPSASKPGE